MFESQSAVDQREYEAQLDKRKARQKAAAKQQRDQQAAKFPTPRSPQQQQQQRRDGSEDDDSKQPSDDGKKSKGSSDHSRPLLTSQHSTYDTNIEEAPRRTVQIKHGEFVWNEDDKQSLHERYAHSRFHSLRQHLPFSASRTLTRAHLYGTNAIKSTRYSILSFLPVNLFEQLAPWIKPANFYFLCIAVLQAFPSISTTQGRPSILLPLFIVITISAVKDAVEDYGRAKQDWLKNNEKFKTYRKGHFHHVTSKELLVGDLVMIEDGQRVPADCILLISGVGGGSMVYVDTKNLDGETNLKPKQVAPGMLREGFREEWRGVGGLSVKVTVDGPNGDMRSFSGEIKVGKNTKSTKKGKSVKTPKGSAAAARGGAGDDMLSPKSPAANKRRSGGSSDDSEPLTLDNFILSDCLVRNTPWLIGLIIYSGEDSKIRQNMKAQLTETRRKETRVFSMTKKIFVLMVVVQIGMCIVAAALAGYYEAQDKQRAWYLRSTTQGVLYYAALRFLTWFIIVKDFIPISLYVSLELVQFLQALFMQWDAEMRVTMNGQELGTRVNTSSLNEELAQVHYIFSDKTGTLTENSMVYRKCVIGSEWYGKGQTEAGLIRQAKDEGKDVKQAIQQFSEEKRKEREEQEEREKEGKGKDDREKHVEFDEVDVLRELLHKSKKEYGESKEKPQKKEEKEGTDGDEKGHSAKGKADNKEEKKKGEKGEGRDKSTPRRETSGKDDDSDDTDKPAKDDTAKHDDGEEQTEEGDEGSEKVQSSKKEKKVRIKTDEEGTDHTADTEVDDSEADEDGTKGDDEESPASNDDKQPKAKKDTADGSKRPVKNIDSSNKNDDSSNTSSKKGSKDNASKKKDSDTDKGSKQSSKDGKHAQQQSQHDDKEGHDKEDEEQADLVREFLYCLCLNNSVFPKVKDDKEAGSDDADDNDDDDDDGKETASSTYDSYMQPMVTALAGVGDVITDTTTEVVEAMRETVGATGGGEDEEVEEKDIEEGEAPEAEKQPDEEEKEGWDDPNSGIIINLEASSPDETALTSFAAVIGFELYSRNEGRVRLRVRDFGEQGGSDSGQQKDGKKAPSTPSKGKQAPQPTPKSGQKGQQPAAREQQEKKKDEGGQEDSDGHVDHSRHFEDFDEVFLIDYNSKRKRMTIILQPYTADGQKTDYVKIYSKGADTAIASLLSDDDPYWDDSITVALQEYGGQSLRTLVCAYGQQPADFYDKFKDKMQSALKQQGASEKGHQDGECSGECKLCAVENEIEDAADLKSLGCTGIEDKLQEGVPNALQQLLDAGMKVWMLTGDTVSTAVNIAMACNLIDSDMENDKRLFVFDKDMDSASKIRQAIDDANKQIEQAKHKHSKHNKQHSTHDETAVDGPLFGLAMHGDVWKKMQRSKKRKKTEEKKEEGGGDEKAKTSPDLFRQKMGQRKKSKRNLLEGQEERSDDAETPKKDGGKNKNKKKDEEAEDQPAEKKDKSADKDEAKDDAKPSPSASSSSSSESTLLDHFFTLCSSCQSVIACRLEPKEKADIVDQMRDRTHRTCLAIGDGNNDTLMIKRADIGVGIAGVEGTSAVSSSDFALSQFRFLPRLLLVHGRLNHRRISVMINYIFYKTAFVVWALFFFGIYSQFSGQVFILDWAFQLHNVAYTALPIIVFAIFDFDLQQSTLNKYPAIYPLTRYTGEHLSFWRAFIAKHPSSLFFSYWDFFEWIIVSIFHALICFFISITAFNTGVSPDPNGQQYGLFEQGLLIYTTIILVTNCMLVYFFCSWTYLHHLSLWGSVALYVAAMCVFSSSTIFDIAGASFYWSWYRLCGLPAFYLTVLVCVGGCMLVTAFWVQGKRWLTVRDEKVWMEAEKLGTLDQLHDKEGDKGDEDDEEEESSDDEDDEAANEEDVRYRRMEERRQAGKRKKEAADERKEAVLEMGGDDEDERKTPIVSPRRVPLRSPHRQTSEGYTGSLFSYTPGIRSLRNVVDI